MEPRKQKHMADETSTSEQAKTEDSSAETTDHSPDAAQVGTSDGDGESS